jgi:hypothetical protein
VKLFAARALFGALSLCICIAAATVAQAAPCGPFQFTDNPKLAGDKLMIVTHPSTLWDGRFASKVGMDAAVIYAKKRGIPVVYLEGQDAPDTYFFSDCAPDYWVPSYGGEFMFEVPARHVYSVGGHWEMCQLTTQNDLMKAWGKKRGMDLVFTQVLDGLYAYGGYVLGTDPYAADFKRFMDIISFRKPGEDEWPKRKLNMLEMMGVINHEARAIEHLKRGLPRWTDISDEYEIRMTLNGKFVEVLRPGKGEKPNTLTFEFVDSLYESGFARALR